MASPMLYIRCPRMGCRDFAEMKGLLERLKQKIRYMRCWACRPLENMIHLLVSGRIMSTH